MEKTINVLRCFTTKYRIWIGLVLVILAGAMLSLSLSTLYFNRQLDIQRHALTAQINRLTADVDFERNTNRKLLKSIVRRADKLSKNLDHLAAQLTQATKDAQQASDTAESAAKTVKAITK